MNDEQNPHRPSESSPETALAPSSPDRLVFRGRLAYLGIAVLLLFLHVGMPLLFGKEPSFVRFGVTAVLLYFGWSGALWAITFLAIGVGFGVIVTIAQLAKALFGDPASVVVMLLLLVLARAGALLALLRSQSLKAFFRHQEERRWPDGPDSALTRPATGTTVHRGDGIDEGGIRS